LLFEVLSDPGIIPALGSEQSAALSGFTVSIQNYGLLAMYESQLNVVA
jgi:hypothetical protein